MPARSKASSTQSLSRAKSKKATAATDSESETGAEYNSDALDDTDSEGLGKNQKKRKRKPETRKKIRAPKKKRTVDTDDEFDVQDGQEIVGVVVQAPKTGLVPPGQISKNTLDFLTQLLDPKCNDREWFKLHEPVYRQAETEWKDFVEVFTDLIIEVDDEIPPLPAKDVVHRIYRDVRFSNDKTPYKPELSASFSRSGRKGIFAHYFILIKPGNQSILGAGVWCPNKNELDTLRSNIQRDSARLRRIISDPTFVEFFGKPEPGAKRNIFGRESELKVAPKGISKTHPDIDLLKCRSFLVSSEFTDAEVLSPDFKTKLAETAGVMMPFVHCLNDMMTLPPDAQDADEDEE